ncbi:uncharacterized protein LOC112685948 [Sipha flava]|uniref:Uncharacterized protein LOC112685948 n=1 Tax=Sipha flava TaxID=143950 RepID=A0A8B8FTP9_9HEMI|nr:uncharacterized protein LOC112685948 [Sipha flava]
MADADIADMLKAWGLEQYIDVFQNEGIDITCLNILTEDMMKELVPKIGHRAKIKANVDEWRKLLDLTNDT